MIPLPSSTSMFNCYLEWDDPKSSTSLRPARVAQLSGTKDADSLSDVDGLRCAAGVAVPPVSHDRWTPKRYGFKTLWQSSIALLDSIVWWHIYILCTFLYVWTRLMFFVGWCILEVLQFRHRCLTRNYQSELKSLASADPFEEGLLLPSYTGVTVH